MGVGLVNEDVEYVLRLLLAAWRSRWHLPGGIFLLPGGIYFFSEHCSLKKKSMVKSQFYHNS